jgi:hypothetical protein
MFAPDPSALVLSHVLSPALLNVPLQDVLMLSLSTGRCREYHEFPDHDWGFVQWAPRLPSVLWGGMVSCSQLCCQGLLGEHLHRVDPVLKEQCPLDTPEALPDLTAIGTDHDLTATFEWIQKHLYD